ncbi:MAG: hypothetical protein WCJ53_04505 [Mycobacteriaceae bacterium]
MAGRSNDSGVGFAVLVVVGGVIWVITHIPKEVWITLAITAFIGLVVWLSSIGWAAYERRRAAARELARQREQAEAAMAKKQREENARRAKQQLINDVGPENAALIESVRAAVKRVAASEAARAGWLGDVDFTTDLLAITSNFKKVKALRNVADELSTLDKPGPDDQKIIAEGRSTADAMGQAAIEWVNLIKKCEAEAKLVDESLQAERKDAKTAEQRAALHAKLSSMLYGIEAAPSSTPEDSAADAVMARVQAYREIKNQIQQSRDG